MDELSMVFAGLPKYRSPEAVRDFLKRLLDSRPMRVISAQAQ